MKKKFNTQIYRREQAQIIKIACFLIAFAVVPSVHPEQLDEAMVTAQGVAKHWNPMAGNGEGIVVRLEMPWKVLLWGESLSFNYIIENHSSAPIPMAVPYRKYGLGSPSGGQAFLEGVYNPEPFWRTLPGNEDQPWLRVQTAEWPPRGMDGQLMESWVELAPGQRIVWNHARMQPGYYRVSADEGLVGIQAHWLVGPTKWISSESTPIKVVKVPESAWEEMFSADWASFDSALDKRTTKVWKIAIEEKWFLFTTNRLRICEVADQDKIGFRMDAKNNQVEVTIKGGGAVRRYYCNLNQGLTRETPWVERGFGAYIPRPEPISEPDPQSSGSFGIRTRGHTSSGVSTGADASSDSRWPRLATAGAACLVLAAAFFLIRRKW